MWLGTGLSRTEFAFLTRSRATSRATDTLYLFEGWLLSLHGYLLMQQPAAEKWSILHRNSDSWRKIAIASDIRPEEIQSALREMGVAAPLPRGEARIALATEAARRAISGESNVFNEATHIRIHMRMAQRATGVAAHRRSFSGV